MSCVGVAGIDGLGYVMGLCVDALPGLGYMW